MSENEKEEMETFDIRQMLGEIKKYKEIPKKEILDFLLQDRKDDTAFFYYKNMLLQLVEFNEHFERMLHGYDHKLGTTANEPFLHKMLNDFCYGDTDEIRKIIKFATDVAKLKSHHTEWRKLEGLTSEWHQLYIVKKVDAPHKMEENAASQKQIENAIEVISREIELKGRGFTHFLEKRKLQKQKVQLEAELSKLKDEHIVLEIGDEENDKKLDEKIQQIRQVFASIDMQELGEKIIGDFPNAHYTSFFTQKYRNNS